MAAGHTQSRSDGSPARTAINSIQPFAHASAIAIRRALLNARGTSAMSHAAIDPEPVRRLLDGHDFVALFREHLGWDRHDHTMDVPVGSHTFRLGAVAEKRNFAVYLCSPDPRGRVPDRTTRDAIERVLAKTAHEHLVIFADKDRRHQVWMWVRRVPGKPASQQSYEWFKGQPTGQILQRVLPTLAIAFEDDDTTTLPDVRARVAAAFDVEKVTKKFFERFQKEHAAFHKFIDGIKVAADRDWYASVMLNRLMFCYFIQKKGLLDGDRDYLRNRLSRLQTTKGKDKFWTFYQHFLLRLFHEGLSTKPAQRSKDLDALIGRIPYLNGGLFDIHEIEERYDDIQIPDAAFEKLFKFFDEYRWHLDERPLRENNEINPDVLGYIFEKYINQKQMGAYYTKEDITGYISQNTIIPYILDQAAAACTIAFVPPAAPNAGGSVWRLLQDDPDRYLYEPVRRGVIDDTGDVVPLPEEIAAGVDNVSKRGGWNKPATDPFGLPTETWREHVARRERCLDLRRKLAAGEVSAVNDLVTLNLDIRQFAADVIERCEGPDLLRAMWKAVESVTVLDPTCGSGAFLFAALNVLEPLYEACLDRMGAFLDTLARDAAAAAEGKGRAPAPDTFADFCRILDRVGDHPNRRYFILKSIIVNNLYGVDLMEEACEICKLRLFLKLVAQVEEGLIEKIEPLPDIDFNIRSGNTLVGFANLQSVRAALAGRLDFGGEFDRISQQATAAAAEFERFRNAQTAYNADVAALVATKQALRQQLRTLEGSLNVLLAGEYGVPVDRAGALDKWRSRYQPFHWSVDFHAIMVTGGLSIIIGNPPYIELKELKGYTVRGYATEPAGNLYALVIEQCLSLLSPQGRLGMIVPVSSISTERYESLQRLLTARALWYSAYDDRPSRLFDGLEHIRLTIHLVAPPDAAPSMMATRYHKWSATERPTLFERLAYVPATPCLVPGTLPKLNFHTERSIIARLQTCRHRLSEFISRNGRHSIYYSRKVGYFLQVLNFEPEVLDGQGERRPPSEFKELSFRTRAEADAALCCLNSNLFYWFVTVFSDCRHLNRREVEAFPFDLGVLSAAQSERSSALARTLMNDLRAHSEQRRMKFKHDHLTVQCIIPKRSKAVIDTIDLWLAEVLGLSAVEADFVMNYDFKYRMGDSAADEEEDEE
ncbi:MAG: Eco57I restriction-modification methylase domain-containing protein [Phycisphaeraceae bacterium]|nr:Eco57I restriction-modification methylase domain-containing protein [Phycisphaeraceae bacterium]